MDNVEEKINMLSNPIKFKQKRKSKRVPKKRTFFHEQKFKTNKKRKISSSGETEEEGSELPTPISDEEIRECHIERLTNVFRNYISNKLDELDLPIDREKTRVTGMVKNLKNSITMSEKVYDSGTMGYLVTSSDGKETYTVKQKAFADIMKYVCNCGTKYEDPDRTSCKHCGAIMFHNFDQFMTDYLTKKPTENSMNLQMHHMQKNFNKFDIDDPKDLRVFEDPVKPSVSKQYLTEAEQSEQSIPLYSDKNIDFFNLVLQGC